MKYQLCTCDHINFPLSDKYSWEIVESFGAKIYSSGGPQRLSIRTFNHPVYIIVVCQCWGAGWHQMISRHNVDFITDTEISLGFLMHIFNFMSRPQRVKCMVDTNLYEFRNTLQCRDISRDPVGHFQWLHLVDYDYKLLIVSPWKNKKPA